MVFLLEDIAKLESDRSPIVIEEKFTFLQETYNIFEDTKAYKFIRELMEEYVAVQDNYVWGKETIGILGVFTDAFLNAGMWGNQDKPGTKIEFLFKYGIQGNVIIIQDEGNGFDYMSQIEKIQNGKEHYFQHRGGGMRKFHNYRGFVAYHGCGNILSISTKSFTEDESEAFLLKK